MKTSLKVFHWLPRIMCIVAILFISMFALDAFEPRLTIWQQLSHFFMHLIPSFVLLGFLVIASKWEKAGGIIFLIIGAGFSPLIFLMNYHRNHSIWISIGIILVITIPFAVVGVLFLVSYSMKKKHPDV